MNVPVHSPLLVLNHFPHNYFPCQVTHQIQTPSSVGAGIHHATSVGLVLLRVAVPQERFAVLCLLLKLNQVAASAAEGLGNILNAVALEVVLFADRGTLHAGKDPVKTTAARAAEEKARGVDGLIALHVGILVDSVVSLAECDTRDTASDEAKVNGVEAVEQMRGPANSTGRGSRVDVIARSRQDIVESILPVIHIIIVDRSTLGRSRRLSGCLNRGCNRSNRSLSGSRHLDGRFWVSKEVVNGVNE